jgi:site-specific DNA recombinase
MKRVDPDRAAAYIRWSTEDQGEGHTLEVQREHCQRVFREHGWQWDEARVYVDAGYSGTVIDRPALTRLRRAVRLRQIECVVVYRLDRLSRRTSDTLVLIQDEWDGLCHFVSATEPISTLGGMADIVLPLLSTVGEMDRNRIISNTRAGKYAAAAKGKPMGRLPYGYLPGGQIDPVCAGVVRRIFREYLSGLGQAAIAARLNRERIPSPRGAAWSQVTVGNLLRNQAYTGHLVYAARVVNPRRRRHPEEPRYLPGPKPIVVADAYPRLVSDADFAAAARLRGARAGPGRRGLTGPFLLSRLARCLKCGSALVGVRSSAGRTYYACRGASRHLCACDGRLIRQAELEGRVLAFLSDERPDPAELARVWSCDAAAAVGRARALLAAAQAEQQRVAAARRRWLEAFEQGALTAEAVRDRLVELGAREADANAAVTAAAEAWEAAAAAESCAPTAPMDVWSAAAPDERKRLLRCFVREVRAYAAPDGTKQVMITLHEG